MFFPTPADWQALGFQRHAAGHYEYMLPELRLCATVYADGTLCAWDEGAPVRGPLLRQPVTTQSQWEQLLATLLPAES